jgi:hypothetical protein
LKLEEVQFKLLSELQALPSELALEYCNKALKEIYREHDWSFLYKKGFIRTPRLINIGTVEVEKFSSEVIVSASLKAILDAIAVEDVPLVGRQFRTFGGQNAGSQFIYTIANYESSTSTLTIDPFYQDESNSASTFQIFKNQYLAPTIVEGSFEGIDFESFDYIYAPFAQRKLWLDRTLADLERRDASRWQSGDPNWAVSSGLDSDTNQLFEFYPIPVNERIYQVRYKRSGRDLQPEDNIPASLDYDLIIAKAKLKAYEWFVTNGDKVGDKRSPNVFMNMIALQSNPSMENSYQKLLALAKKRDEDLYPQALIDLGSNWPYYSEVVVETVLMDF